MMTRMPNSGGGVWFGPQGGSDHPPATSAFSSSTPPPHGPQETAAPHSYTCLILLLLLTLFLPSPAPASAASLSPLAATFTGREPVPAPDPTFFDDVIDAVADKYGWDPDAEVRVWPLDAEGTLIGAVQRYEFRARAGGAVVALARASDGAVDWSRPDAPAVEEVVGPDGIDFVTGDGALEFGSGVRVLDMVGPFELVVSDGAGGGRAELQLPS